MKIQNTLKTKSMVALIAILWSSTISVKAQIPVTDIANIAQSITNSVLEIAEATTTATNVINTFNEAKKIYDQGKEYYDKLKAVNDLVKDARKVQKTVLMVGEITDIYMNNYEKMLSDENYSAGELSAIASGYSKLLQEATDALKELKTVVNSTGLSMTDKERMDIIDRSYNEVKHYRDLTAYYTRKTISVSYLRAKKSNDTKRIIGLYGKDEDKYW